MISHPRLSLLLAAGLLPLFSLPARAGMVDEKQGWTWKVATPESQGMNTAALEAAWKTLKEHRTSALIVIRHDHIVFERYAPGYTRSKPHYTASLAKALVGGMSLMLAMDDHRIKPDDPASRYVPQWRDDPRHQPITIRHLATHNSGIEDAEADDTPHERLTGWKGDFWKRLPPPKDPFTLARDVAPVLEAPGTKERYSNPGMAMLGYCVTASLQGTNEPDLRTLLRKRVMDPLGIPDREWSVGYGTVTTVADLPLVGTWGGGAYSPDAVARVGRLLLHQGAWNGHRLLTLSTVEAALRHSGLPGHSGLGWWVNQEHDGARLWSSAPPDAFGGAGAGHQILMVVPSLDLILVRNGDALDNAEPYHDVVDRFVVAPILKAVDARPRPPYPPSPAIREIHWSPVESIVRKARGSDNWPLTWADDDALYTAFGDGQGFEPLLPTKLSLGFARVTGTPDDFTGVNLRSPSGERLGDGVRGPKASGLIMVDGVLYAWARNTQNAQLLQSSDHARTWTWSDWRFETSFGCPSFLNFGRDNQGARDDFVYTVSPDTPSAYEPADRMVLARVPRDRVADRAAYSFFKALDALGNPIWTPAIADRGAVFEHPGRCYRGTITYNAGLRRYLWCQTLPGGDARHSGGFGIYDAPEPWGPWTTVYFTEHWDVGPGETSSFPTRWISADGKTLHLVFSGNDAFSVRKATLLTTEPHP